MKKITQYLLVLFSVALMVSCGGDVPIPSKISMKIGPGYTSATTTTILVGLNQDIKVGIIASKLEANTNLKTFQVSYIYDSSTDATTYYTENLSGTDVNSFIKDYTFKTRGVVGIEKWIFSVTNTAGVTNQVYIVLDVESI